MSNFSGTNSQINDVGVNLIMIFANVVVIMLFLTGKH